MKGNEAYNNMLANVLPLHTPLTPQVGSKGHLYPPQTLFVVYTPRKLCL